MVSILKDLHQDDHFAIILFDNKIKTWRESLTKATKTNVSEAINYVRKIKSDSGRNNLLFLSWKFSVNEFSKHFVSSGISLR